MGVNNFGNGSENGDKPGYLAMAKAFEIDQARLYGRHRNSDDAMRDGNRRAPPAPGASGPNSDHAGNAAGNTAGPATGAAARADRATDTSPASNSARNNHADHNRTGNNRAGNEERGSEIGGQPLGRGDADRGRSSAGHGSAGCGSAGRGGSDADRSRCSTDRGRGSAGRGRGSAGRGIGNAGRGIGNAGRGRELFPRVEGVPRGRSQSRGNREGSFWRGRFVSFQPAHAVNFGYNDSRGRAESRSRARGRGRGRGERREELGEFDYEERGRRGLFVGRSLYNYGVGITSRGTIIVTRVNPEFSHDEDFQERIGSVRIVARGIFPNIVVRNVVVQAALRRGGGAYLVTGTLRNVIMNGHGPDDRLYILADEFNQLYLSRPGRDPI